MTDTITSSINYSFSGHETFSCKNFWLKKGYDYLQMNKKFASSDAVVSLGVGKNMVSSIHFWLKAFGFLNENGLTEIADYFLDEKIGKDPYMEDIATIWLLHYHLISTQKASIYALLFNEFFKDRFEFNKERFLHFLAKKSPKTSRNSLNDDFSVLTRNYLKPRKTDKLENIEEAFSGLFVDLNLLTKEYVMREEKKEEIFKLNVSQKTEIPWQIILFSILDNEEYAGSRSISLRDLRYGKNSPGLVFGMNKEGLYAKIEEIEQHCAYIIFTETAGNPVLQFKEIPNKYDILNEYYK